MTSDQVFEVETQALTFRGGSTKSAWDRRGSELPHEVEKDLTPPPQPRAPTLASNYSRASARRRSFQYLRTHAFFPSKGRNEADHGMLGTAKGGRTWRRSGALMPWRPGGSDARKPIRNPAGPARCVRTKPAAGAC